MEAAGLHFVGHDEEGERMEILELQGHPYYVACQYHPEYLTRCVSPALVRSCLRLFPFVLTFLSSRFLTLLLLLM